MTPEQFKKAVWTEKTQVTRHSVPGKFFPLNVDFERYEVLLDDGDIVRPEHIESIINQPDYDAIIADLKEDLSEVLQDVICFAPECTSSKEYAIKRLKELEDESAPQTGIGGKL